MQTNRKNKEHKAHSGPRAPRSSRNTTAKADKQSIHHGNLPSIEAVIARHDKARSYVSTQANGFYNEEFDRLVRHSPDYLRALHAEGQVSTIDDQAYFNIIRTAFRPATSILHTTHPAPPAIMQNGQLFIDGLNWQMSEATKDPNFWWEPVTSVAAMALKSAVEQYRSAVAQGGAPPFMFIK